jgi:hypothetical protein
MTNTKIYGISAITRSQFNKMKGSEQFDGFSKSYILYNLALIVEKPIQMQTLRDLLKR